MMRRKKLRETRRAVVERVTGETKVKVVLDLDDEKGRVKIGLDRKFFKHMLASMAFHGGFTLEIEGEEFEALDDHHLVEDVGLALGEALAKALGDKRGIARFGWAAVPMDEALILASVDLSGRPYFESNLTFKRLHLGDLSTEMINHFFYSFSHAGGFTLHLLALRGVNDHHKAEAAFKAVGLALAQACRKTGGEIPSLKGVL